MRHDSCFITFTPHSSLPDISAWTHWTKFRISLALDVPLTFLVPFPWTFTLYSSYTHTPSPLTTHRTHGYLYSFPRCTFSPPFAMPTTHVYTGRFRTTFSFAHRHLSFYSWTTHTFLVEPFLRFQFWTSPFTTFTRIPAFSRFAIFRGLDQVTMPVLLRTPATSHLSSFCCLSHVLSASPSYRVFFSLPLCHSHTRSICCKFTLPISHPCLIHAHYGTFFPGPVEFATFRFPCSLICVLLGRCSGSCLRVGFLFAFCLSLWDFLPFGTPSSGLRFHLDTSFGTRGSRTFCHGLVLDSRHTYGSAHARSSFRCTFTPAFSLMDHAFSFSFTCHCSVWNSLWTAFLWTLPGHR